MFLGNFTEAQPPQKLMGKLKAFLDFAVDLGKIPSSYELLGERQLEETSSPGDKLYEILQIPPFDNNFSFNVTRPSRRILF